MIRTLVNPSLRVSVRTKRIKDICGAVGLAEQESGQIEIDPRQCPKEMLCTLVHEWLHIALPKVSERNIVKLEKSLGGMLWRRGYRRKW